MLERCARVRDHAAGSINHCGLESADIAAPRCFAMASTSAGYSPWPTEKPGLPPNVYRCSVLMNSSPAAASRLKRAIT